MLQFDDLVRHLTWTAQMTAWQPMRSLFVRECADALGATLARLERNWPGEAHALWQRLDALPDTAFNRILTAPETTYRLFFPDRHDDADTRRFLRGCVRAERILCGLEPDAGEPVWTATGEAAGAATRGQAGGPSAMSGRMRIALDFCSPHARDLSRCEQTAWRNEDRHCYDPPQRQELALRIEATVMAIGTAVPAACAFVEDFTQVLMFFDTIGDAQTGLVSRSPEHHIGLTVLVNAHLPAVTPVALAEALVHEAIHAFLEMHELIAMRSHPALRWFPHPAMYDGSLRTRSPWTGARLPLPTFVHACFVWHALVHFWLAVLDTDAFDKTLVLPRLRQALAGFAGAHAVTAQLDPFRENMHPGLLAAIDRLTAETAALMSDGMHDEVSA